MKLRLAILAAALAAAVLADAGRADARQADAPGLPPVEADTVGVEPGTEAGDADVEPGAEAGDADPGDPAEPDTAADSAAAAPADTAAATPARALGPFPRPIPAPAPDSAAAARRIPSPGGIFLRQLLVPGWGHAILGANIRGSVYFAARAGSLYMLVRTIGRLDQARGLERRQSAAVRDSLLARAAEDPDFARQLERPGALEAAIAEHPRTKVLRELVSAREQQREDWITWTIFWTLISGADAFVSAHLSDFPAQVTAEPEPDGGVRLQLRVPVPTPP